MQTQSLDADFYESHRDDLMRYATALVGLNDAADVVSRVIVRILSKRNRHLRDPRGYAMKAVLNEARSWLRRRRTAPLIDADTAVDHPDPVPEVVTAVMELPVRQTSRCVPRVLDRHVSVGGRRGHGNPTGDGP